MTLWKRQNSGDSKQISGCQRLEGLRVCISNKFPMLLGLKFLRFSGLGMGRRNEICIHNGVSYFAVRSPTLFWPYILNPSLLCCLLKLQRQSAGDKFHYSTFFEFSQRLLSIPLLVLALCCYFKDLLVFPRWFLFDARRCE